MPASGDPIGLPTTGEHLIGGRREPGTGPAFTSFDPRSGAASRRTFREPGIEQVDRAVQMAAQGIGWNGFAPADVRAEILVGIAAALDGAASSIIPVADRESALGVPRLTGELARTTGQLRAFADALSKGYHLDRVTDITPDGTELLRVNVPVGAVAVFEASNFPLAFATMGGDTAAALAAGCGVVVKAHPDHPETSELVGRLASEVLDGFNAGGSLSVLHGPSPDLGGRLVQHPSIAAVGFTGSVRGGRALFDLAARRETPIPVYAEMGSVNPLVVTPAAAATRAESIAEGYVASLLLGGGQFCTKPGLLLVPAGPGGDRLIQSAAAAIASEAGPAMLDERIRDAYQAGVQELSGHGVSLATGTAPHGGFAAQPILVELEPPLAPLEEVFGPAGVVVRYGSIEELTEIVSLQPGALTAAIHVSEEDPDADRILAVVAMKVGRIVWNGYPTGVAVSPAMMHGGPYPATTDPLHTSVGLRAMRRFQRPVAFQNVPAGRLPSSFVQTT